MKIVRIKHFSILLAILATLFAVSASYGNMLPEGLIMENVFKPGHGFPIGKIQLVQGDVVIMHEDQAHGYWAKNNLPIYKKDIIVTKEKSRIRLLLNDKSIITLSSMTKTILTRSVYSPDKKLRSIFINMVQGKAIFWAQKLTSYKRSEFRVKSPTAVVGVRGSKWIESVTKDATKVTTLEDTILEVISVIAPEVEPSVLKEFEQIVIEEGKLPSEVVKVSIDEIVNLKMDFTITLADDGAEGKIEKLKEDPEKDDGEEGDKGELSIVVPVEELDTPEKLEIPDNFETQSIKAEQEVFEDNKKINEESEKVLEEYTEETDPEPVPAPVPENTGSVGISW